MPLRVAAVARRTTPAPASKRYAAPLTTIAVAGPERSGSGSGVPVPRKTTCVAGGAVAAPPAAAGTGVQVHRALIPAGPTGSPPDPGTRRRARRLERGAATNGRQQRPAFVRGVESSTRRNRPTRPANCGAPLRLMVAVGACQEMPVAAPRGRPRPTVWGVHRWSTTARPRPARSRGRHEEPDARSYSRRSARPARGSTSLLPAVFSVAMSMRLMAVAACLPSCPVGADQFPTAKPESVGLSSARLERLAQAIRRAVDEGRMPGAVVAIARRGKLAYHEAFGFVDKSTNTPMPKDAIFALASMTKPMAAVATLMLVEEGSLLLNDPVGNYLPALKNMKVATATGTEPARRQPTLQDMLRHTAGVSYGNRGDTPLHKLYSSKLRSADGQSSRRVSGRTGQAATALSARLDVGLQLRSGRRGPGGGGGDEEAPWRVPAGAAVRAARHGGHGVRGAGVEGGAHREAARRRPGDRPAPDLQGAGEAVAVPTAAAVARPAPPPTTSASRRCC